MGYAVDGVRRGRTAPVVQAKSFARRRGNQQAPVLFFVVLLAGLGFWVVRPSTERRAGSLVTEASGRAGESAPAPKSDSVNTSVPAFGRQPSPGDDSGSAANLIILDQPTKFSAPQADSPPTPAGGESEPTIPTPDSFSVRILNGGARAGAAATLRDELVASGFAVRAIGNAQSTYQATTIYYQANRRAEAELVSQHVEDPTPTLAEDTIAAPADVLVVIGTDYE